MKHRFTNCEAIAGAAAVLGLSDKAREGYNGTDPLKVYEVETESPAGGMSVSYWVEDADGTQEIGNILALESYLESLVHTPVITSWMLARCIGGDYEDEYTRRAFYSHDDAAMAAVDILLNDPLVEAVTIYGFDDERGEPVTSAAVEMRRPED